MLTVKEAQKKIIDVAWSFGDEVVLLKDALGRTIFEEIEADRNYPPFNRATMDGYAISATDLNEKGIREFIVVEEVFAGKKSEINIHSGECIKIMTGAAVPSALNAVIRVEDTLEEKGRVKMNIEAVYPNQNIALEGEDAQKNEILIRKNTLITSSVISSLAVLGKSRVKVYKNPQVAIISTGNEIRKIDDTVEAHQVRDSNFYSIEAFLKKYNIPIAFQKMVEDDKAALTKVIKEALEYDVVITSGGVSMGDADFLPSIFESVGVEKIFHKVEVKPGKPLWLGQTSQTLLFGLPGNPVSVQVACKIFVEPLLRKCFGLDQSLVLKLPMGHSKKKKTKFDEFFPGKIVTGEASFVYANKYNGSGDVTATLHSDGLVLHEAQKNDLMQGDLVSFYPWNL